MTFYIPKPDDSMYENRHNESSNNEKITNDFYRLAKKGTFVLEKIDCSEGIKRYYFGAPIHAKGFPTSEAVDQINLCKRLLLEFIKLKPIVFSLEKTLKAYNSICHQRMKFYYLKWGHQMEFTQHLYLMIWSFLTSIGISDKTACSFSKTISHIFEYDVAYRFRLQDVISEMKEVSFHEIRRLMTLMAERESDPRLKETILSFRKYIFLLIPYKKKLFEAMEDFKYLKYDDSDLYWTSLRDDSYKYQGKTHKERMEGKEFPTIIYPMSTM